MLNLCGDIVYCPVFLLQIKLSLWPSKFGTKLFLPRPGLLDFFILFPIFSPGLSQQKDF